MASGVKGYIPTYLFTRPEVVDIQVIRPVSTISPNPAAANIQAEYRLVVYRQEIFSSPLWLVEIVPNAGGGYRRVAQSGHNVTAHPVFLPQCFQGVFPNNQALGVRNAGNFVR